MKLKLTYETTCLLNKNKNNNANLHLYNTPQPNRSKVFELQQSNQGYGETQGAQEVQKNTFGKYFTEPFLR